MNEHFRRDNYRVWRDPDGLVLVCWDVVAQEARTVALRALEALAGGYGRGPSADEVFADWPIEAVRAVCEFWSQQKAAARRATEAALPHNRIVKALNLTATEADELLADLPYRLQEELAAAIESLPTLS